MMVSLHWYELAVFLSAAITEGGEQFRELGLGHWAVGDPVGVRLSCKHSTRTSAVLGFSTQAIIHAFLPENLYLTGGQRGASLAE
jgi:hypothetical protein